jgi:hypothetical protein
MRNLSLIIIIGVVLSACGQTNPSYSLLPDQQQFTQSASDLNNKVDIIWVVDNSVSMQPAQDNLVANFRSFITDFSSKAYDFSISVITTETYLAAASFRNDANRAKFRDRGLDSDGTWITTGISRIVPATANLIETFMLNARQGVSGTGDERAFSSLKESLLHPVNAPSLRDGAFLAVIIVSDEDDFSSPTRLEWSWVRGGTGDHSYTAPELETVASYVDFLDVITGSVPSNRHHTVSTISILDDTCGDTYKQTSPNAIVGQRYIEIADATRGIKGSICDASFADSLKAIQNQIFELSTRFTLNRIPIPESITVVVDGVSISEDPANGWTFDAEANAVVFHGTAIPAQGARIAIDFDPVTVRE